MHVHDVRVGSLALVEEVKHVLPDRLDALKHRLVDRPRAVRESAVRGRGCESLAHQLPAVRHRHAVHAVTFDHVRKNAGVRVRLDARRARVCEWASEATRRRSRSGLLADHGDDDVSASPIPDDPSQIPISASGAASRYASRKQRRGFAREASLLHPSLHKHTPRVFGDISASPRPPRCPWMTCPRFSARDSRTSPSCPSASPPRRCFSGTL